MSQTNFITTNELKEFTAIAQSVDVNLLVPFIDIAEQMHLYPILGTAMVTEFKTQIEEVTLTADNETLLNEYIIPFDSWATFLEAAPFLLFRTNGKGITKSFSDSSQSIDRFELSVYKQAIIDKVSFYKNRLVEYLQANKTKYPLFCPDTGATIKSNSTGFWLG